MLYGEILSRTTKLILFIQMQLNNSTNLKKINQVDQRIRRIGEASRRKGIQLPMQGEPAIHTNLKYSVSLTSSWLPFCNPLKHPSVFLKHLWFSSVPAAELCFLGCLVPKVFHSPKLPFSHNRIPIHLFLDTNYFSLLYSDFIGTHLYSSFSLPSMVCIALNNSDECDLSQQLLWVHGSDNKILSSTPAHTQTINQGKLHSNQ